MGKMKLHMTKNSVPKVAWLVSASFSLAVSAISVAEDYSARAFYGDPTFDRVVAVDVPSMTQAGETFTAAVPYPVDRAGNLNKVYAITRGAPSMDIIDPDTLTNVGSVELEHNPRSGEAYNARLGVQLVAGADKPMSSIIDPKTDTVLTTAGENIVTVPNGDYGGSLASGHPYWFNHREFAVIDRSNRKISLYRLVGKKKRNLRAVLLDQMDTPTSVHHFVDKGKTKRRGWDRFVHYAVAEGSPNNAIAPQLLKIVSFRGKLRLVDSAKLPGDPLEMGSHHADLHPDGRHIYQGSNEGNLFVIDRYTMDIVATVATGLGSGHTRFIPERDIAVITNHKDEFLTVVDLETHTKIDDIVVSGPQQNGQILQSHTTFVDPQADNFYAFASDNGYFYELNLDYLEVSRTVDTGGTPRQGVFIVSHEENGHRHE